MFKIFLYIIICLGVSSAAMAQASKRATALYAAGLAAAKKDMYGEAMVSFKKAVALNKTYDSAYTEMGNIYTKADINDSAIFCYNKALAINPRMRAAFLGLGKIYREKKQNFDSAITCFLSALKIDSVDKVTYYNLAWCYNAKRDYDNAIPTAVKALNIDSNYKEGYNELGHAYNASKRYAEGVIQFRKSFSTTMNDLGIHYCGLCYIQLKDKEGALEMYELLKKLGSKKADILKRKIDAMQ